MACSKEDAETVKAFFEDARAERAAAHPLGWRAWYREGDRGLLSACCANAAWRIACATWPAKFLRRYGRSSRRGCKQLIKRRAVRLRVSLPPDPTGKLPLSDTNHVEAETPQHVQGFAQASPGFSTVS